MRQPGRLRWQLTLSHLKATAFTLVSLTAAVVLIATGWFHAQDEPSVVAARDARLIAQAIGGAVARGEPSGRLDELLAALAAGELRLSADDGPPWAAASGQGFESSAPRFQENAYVAVVGADGVLLASSGPSGRPVDPAERGEWAPLVGRALAGERDLRRLSVERSGSSPAALGAYPVMDERNRPIAAVVVGRTALPPAWTLPGALFQTLAVVGASLVVLLAASGFALVSSGIVAYLLARRLVGRLERLGVAAEALASGDLSSRVDEGAPDEVGQLARRFNRMAEQLASTVAQLETTLKTKRELVANVSHELRTPLASIRGHLESLAMQGREDEYLAVIRRESAHLSRLVDDLFLLATTESGGLSLTLEPVALGEVVEQVAEDVRPAARRERRITVLTEVAPDLPPALADRQRVGQILGNLVRNALRHTPEGGLVSVRADRHDGRARLTVEDTGVGIPPELLAQVFDRFYRVDAGRDRESGGAGLGLAIVRELAEAMGGTVAAESTPGVGSTFIVTLPLAVDRRPTTS